MEEEVDMVLASLTLTNFRNFSQKKLPLAYGATLIYGENTSGKSNLLEAVYLLATGGSLRAERTVELIREGETFARIEGWLSSGGGEGRKLEIILEKENNEENRTLKKFRVNGVPRRRRDFLGNLTAVLFSPEQLNLINNGPAYRRNYLDLTLSQRDKNYFVAISAYNKARINRNKILYQINKGIGKTAELSYWDVIIVENSLVVVKQRQRYINFINESLIEDKKKLWGERWRLQLKYIKSPLTSEKLEEHQAREIAAGKTLIGPHREDVLFLKVRIDTDRGETRLRTDTEGVDLHRYGSRGEQRLAVLALKLAEWEFLAGEGDKPLLLLDDIFSELDDNHRKIIFNALAAEQTLVTTAEEGIVRDLIPKDWPVLRLP